MQSSWKSTCRMLAMGAVIAGLAACASQSVAPVTNNEVRIQRDQYGVPHIYANSVLGLYHGFGYALAEDRLFQIEMSRRTYEGSVAEILGPGQGDKWVASDRAALESYDRDSLTRQLARLKGDDRAVFEGYAAGVNARIKEVLADKAKLLPNQFNHFGFEPSPTWTDIDVMLMFVGSAYRYSSYNTELANLRLLQSLIQTKGRETGAQIFDQLRWKNDPTAPTTVGDDPVTRPRMTSARSVAATNQVAGAGNDHLLSAFQQLSPMSSQAILASLDTDFGPMMAPTASNLWIAGPTKTVDGSVHFNNGPQFGNFNPGYTWGVALHGAGFDIVGNTTAGSPTIHFATNGRIAWGSTAGAGDTIDTYQLELNPANQNQYRFNGAYRDFTKLTQRVKVKGRPDFLFDIYSGVHGRVSSFDRPSNAAFARKRSWEGEEVESLLGLIESSKAVTWEQWKKANSRATMSFSRYYADVDGNIGYLLTGKYPRRPSNQDVRLPAKGDGTMEWQGFLPFASNPQVLNPAQGFIVNWNNKPSSTFDNTDTFFWSHSDRVTEFIELFHSKPKFTPTEVQDMNKTTSYIELHTRNLVPFMVDAVKGLPAADPVRTAVDSIQKWDKMLNDPRKSGFYAPEYTVFLQFTNNLMRATFEDDIPAAQMVQVALLTPPTATRNVSPGFKALINALMGEKSGVAQRYEFFNGADKSEVIRHVIAQTLKQLQDKHATADRTKWLTPITQSLFFVDNFVGVPQALIEEQLGGGAIMNRGAQNHHIRLSRSGVESCDVTPPGQGGSIAADGKKPRHYDDQMKIFDEFTCKRQWIQQSDIDSNTESTKTLKF